MSDDLTLCPDVLSGDKPATLPEVVDLADRARAYAARAMGEGTKRAYRAALIQFESFCESVGADPLAQAEDVLALYLTQLAEAGRSVSTVMVHKAAVRAAWRAACGSASPSLASVTAGIARTYGLRPQRKAAPLGPELMRRLLEVVPDPDSALGARDRAMMLIGLGGAL